MKGNVARGGGLFWGPELKVRRGGGGGEGGLDNRGRERGGEATGRGRVATRGRRRVVGNRRRAFGLLKGRSTTTHPSPTQSSCPCCPPPPLVIVWEGCYLLVARDHGG